MPDPDFPERLGEFHEPIRRRPPRRRGRIFAGVLAALALGAAGGLIMRPDLNGDRPDAQPAARDAALPGLPENLSELLPPPMPMPALPELQPDDETPPEPEAETDEPPEPREAEPEDDPEPEPREDRTVSRRFDEVEPQPRPQPQPRPAPAPRVTVNCSRATSTAERLVCVDPRLRSLDQRMAAAYGNALASGVPPPVLRRQQQVWLRAREEAAHYGPEDLAGVYNARIDELRGMSR